MRTKTLLTAAELEQMPDDDSVRTELDEGELITMPPASEEHGGLEAEISGILRDYIKPRHLGKVHCSSAGFRLRDDTVRAPDVSFVRSARIARNYRFSNRPAPIVCYEATILSRRRNSFRGSRFPSANPSSDSPLEGLSPGH